MIALQIVSMKDFMHKLLRCESFHPFLLEEAVIGTSTTFSIDGRINREFYSAQELSDGLPPFAPWSEMQGLCFDLIKGRRTPLFFRFTLQLKPDQAQKLLTEKNCDVPPNQVKALSLNIRYDGAKALLTTATSLHTFFPSKEPDAIWDRAMRDFLAREDIACELL